ncbi:MAG: hypothetical protein R3E58_08855 [Phycisphaerae bacterium]
MRTSITMMFGHIETVQERIESLQVIRDLQDETGGFTAFITWTFQPDNTPLGRMKQFPPSYQGLPDGKHLMLADSNEYCVRCARSHLPEQHRQRAIQLIRKVRPSGNPHCSTLPTTWARS